MQDIVELNNKDALTKESYTERQNYNYIIIVNIVYMKLFEIGRPTRRCSGTSRLLWAAPVVKCQS